MFLRAAIGLLALLSSSADSQTTLPDLTGTAWDLVSIQSMNDTISHPTADGDYRLIFGVDGSVSVTAGCNRGSGSLTDWRPPRLEFSQFASTRAHCGPSSLSDRFLSELGWVRSFVYDNHRLYLATMADGSILEFKPVPDAVATATVEGISIITTDPDSLRSIILTQLLDRYALENNIVARDADINRYIAQKDKRLKEMLGSDYEDTAKLDEGEREEVERIQRSMAESMIKNWKTNKALYEQYGGRVVFQQLGPEPMDAYRLFLAGQEQQGRFSIHSTDLASAFWAFFEDDERHSFYTTEKLDEAGVFDNPPWVTND
ncbi:hypothetical protein NOR51B_2128 [Luminiphilus syltensis NOR5-1B]|uniref:DUF306 domain-containing protein n=1 Tax=Luminiphilus syltensis NOR5-1B TaxID=565045 RepID=B8KVE8_9GAMM|nr:META domain-containing protein [Luminiphilus syltensis]EED36180.1 hypothetical protein NOR51B_2128 [Luminiphilus syltensis NOR5-1B]